MFAHIAIAKISLILLENPIQWYMPDDQGDSGLILT